MVILFKCLYDYDDNYEYEDEYEYEYDYEYDTVHTCGSCDYWHIFYLKQ